LAVIIIPAHNEEAVLADSLNCLLEGLEETVAEVVVVCNGCTDGTAEVARQFAPRVGVTELEYASKTAALNAGDAWSDAYPRVYMDADVAISGASMTALLETLSHSDVVAAQPERVVDTTKSAVAVRIYYAVALALHGHEPGDVGGGVYAMTEKGRSRFGAFPPIIADDAYARAHFASDEITVVTDTTSTVRAPRATGDLIKVGARSRLGMLELHAKYPSLWKVKGASRQSLAAKIARLPPRLWPLLPVYIALTMLIRLRARFLHRDLETYRWDRDESSR
jgi:glycosyltransferase involved in cell wall biosynthesis